MKHKITILILIALFFMTSGLGCKISGEAKNYAPVSLQYWGVNENPADMRSLIGPYTTRHPKISLNYRVFREDEFKQKMLEALALGQGPDLFMIPSTKIREYLKFITPMPSTMKAPVQYEKGTLKKETIDEVRTYNGLSPATIRNTFLDVVAQDVIIDGKVWALPYSVETLSVYYNREMLKRANIALPAANWEELITQVPALTKVDANDAIVQSAIAMGGIDNMPAVLEIISSLMMQVGVTLADNTGPLFQANPESLNAIQFYLTFAQKGRSNYSWSSDLPDAFDLFTAGKLAYFIGYPYHDALIRKTNPQLDYDVIPMFEPAGAENPPSYASYWVTVVTKPRDGQSTQHSELAWQYLLESTDVNNVQAFLNNPERPRTTALRALVDSQKANQFLGSFAQNLLTSKSWYQGYNFNLAEKYFMDMIKNIASSAGEETTVQNFLSAGADLIRQTYRPLE